MKRSLFRYCAAVLLNACSLFAQFPAPRNSIQAIGFNRWNPQDRQYACIVSARSVRPVELAVLPFEFGPEDPFDKMDDYANCIDTESRKLKKVQDLTITVFLAWRENSVGKSIEGNNAFCKSYEEHALGTALMQSGFQDRLDSYFAWVQRVRNRSFKNVTVHLLAAPLLEGDFNCSNQTLAFQNLIGISDIHLRRTFGANVAWRTNRNGGYVRDGALPTEVHGYPISEPRLRTSDVWSPDGDFPTIDQYVAQSGTFAKVGVSSAYWTAGMNGDERIQPQSIRYGLQPFCSSEVNKANLWKAFGVARPAALSNDPCPLNTNH